MGTPGANDNHQTMDVASPQDRRRHALEPADLPVCLPGRAPGPGRLIRPSPCRAPAPVCYDGSMLRPFLVLLTAAHLCACTGAGNRTTRHRPDSATGPAADPGQLRCGEAIYSVSAPDGWRATSRMARAHGMLAAFHPAGDTWDSARVVMAVRCDPGSAPCAHLVARDKERFAKRSRLVVLGEAEPVHTAAGERLELRTFSGGPDGRNEAVAYLKVRGGTLRLILRAANQPAFEAHLPAFEALLGSLRRAQ